MKTEQTANGFTYSCDATEAFAKTNQFLRCIDGRCSPIKVEVELECGEPIKLTMIPVFKEQEE